MKDNPIVLTDLPKMMKIAETAARTAGTYLLQKLGSATVAYQKSPLDDLLDADLEAERLILTKLREETPEIGILSEESGREGIDNQYWIVDPLDGSANFQRGSPLFAIAIALVTNLTTVGGIIYLPTRDEMFVAMQGHGALLNNAPIRVSITSRLSEAIVHVGDFAKDHDTESISERLEDVSKLATQVRRIRMIGTAATDLAYIACGRADMLVNRATTPWDIEAGKLLVLEAGGKAITRQYHNNTALSIYSNSNIHQAATNILMPPEN